MQSIRAIIQSSYTRLVSTTPDELEKGRLTSVFTKILNELNNYKV